jgi:hypothetical protein
MSQLLYSWEKSPWYPLDGRVAGPQNWSQQCGEQENLAPTGTQTLTARPSSLKPVAIPTGFPSTDSYKMGTTLGDGEAAASKQLMLPAEEAI